MQDTFYRPPTSQSSTDLYTPSMEFHVRSAGTIDTVRLSMCNDLSCSEQYLIPDASISSITVNTIPETKPQGDDKIINTAKDLLKAEIILPPTPSKPSTFVQERSKVIKMDTPLLTSSGKYANFKPFLYPILLIPPKRSIPDIDIRACCTDITFLTDGSNASIYSALYQNKEKVIIKMIKEKCQYNSIAIHEFDTELAILSRIDHPNIVRVLGAGRIPRRFILLEAMEGGSLNTKLKQNIAKSGYFHGKLLHQPTFAYEELLLRARELADALDYLHRRCHPGATIIHRDLKPDNIGLTKEGTMKILDFGLSTCVKTRQSSKDTYKMTGYTGSLRYMAPEVALRKSYTERVDVYSFGLILWQMMRDRVPFGTLSKEEIMQLVIQQQQQPLRPKMSSYWPRGLCLLLSDCWQVNAFSRPSFAEIVQRLDHLILLQQQRQRRISLSPAWMVTSLRQYFQ